MKRSWSLRFFSSVDTCSQNLAYLFGLAPIGPTALFAQYIDAQRQGICLVADVPRILFNIGAIEQTVYQVLSLSMAKAVIVDSKSRDNPTQYIACNSPWISLFRAYTQMFFLSPGRGGYDAGLWRSIAVQSRRSPWIFFSLLPLREFSES